MTALCAAVLGLLAGWAAPAVVAQWTGPTGARTHAVGALVCAVSFGTATTLPAGDAFAGVAYWSLCLALVDCHCRRLPNVLTAGGAAAVLTAATWDGFGAAALAGAALLAAVYASGHVVTGGGVGSGDVKLAVPLGAAAATSGGSAWLAAAVSAPVLTAVLALAARPAHPSDRGVPHGPSMCAATLVAWVSVGT